MNIVFMGTPDFAVAPLRALRAHDGEQWSLKLVVTRPDAASSRGKTLLPSPVRVVADAEGIPVITPKSFYSSAAPPRVLDAELLHALAATEPDVFVVAAFGLILPSEILALPRFGCINVHGSLLPRWRGAAPIQRAILAGDEQVGVCIMRMEEGLDTGPYCAVAEISSVGKNALDITEELSALGAGLLLETLPRIASGSLRWIEQNEADATYADKITKYELALHPQDTAVENVRKVLASTPQAPARCAIAGRQLTVLAAQVVDDKAHTQHLCGVFASKDSSAPCVGSVSFINKQLFLSTSTGNFEVTQLKPDGKNVMEAQAFAAGIKELQKGGENAVTWQSIEAVGTG